MIHQKIRIANDLVEAVILPEIGGRIVSFIAYGKEWLWRNPLLLSDNHDFLVQPEVGRRSTTLGNWMNWGGDKSWPSPQGWSSEREWAGPPDPILDSGPYALTDISLTSCRMESLPDPRTGLVIERFVEMHPHVPGLTVTTSMTNVSSVRRSWACWTVTQVSLELESTHQKSHVLVNQEPNPRPPVVLFDAIGRPIFYESQTGDLIFPIQDFVGKLGFPSSVGILKLVLGDGSFFEQKFQVEKGAAYADGDSPAQVWMQFPVSQPIESLQGLTLDARLVELECQSPMADLEPGETVTLRVDWLVGKASANSMGLGVVSDLSSRESN